MKMKTRYFFGYLSLLILVCGQASATCNSPMFNSEISVIEAQDYLQSMTEGAYSAEGAKAEAYVFLSDDGVFDAPLVVVEGFDAENTYDCSDLYTYLNTGNASIDDLRSGNTDLVLVNFEDSTLGIAANAAAVEELLDEINQAKVGNHSSAVIGLSMGGLVARYALTRMESVGKEHGVFLYVSYDTPQKFANIPVGIQAWITGAVVHKASVVPGLYDWWIDQFGSMAVREMIATWPTLESHDGGNSWEVIHLGGGGIPDIPLTLQYNIQEMGRYPNELRKIALVNGSDRGRAAEQFDVNENLMSIQLDTPIPVFTFEFDYFTVGAADYQKYLNFRNCQDDPADLIVCLQSNMYSTLVSPTRAVGEQHDYIQLDNAPGGYTDMSPYFSSPVLNSISEITLTLLQDKISFVPTVSAVDHQVPVDRLNLFHDFSSDPDFLSATPFDAVYFPGNGLNERHLELTQEKYDQLLQELAWYHRPFNSDDDQDGLSNKREMELGTLMRTGDSDADGLEDGFEAKYGLNPLSETAQEKIDDVYGNLDGDGFSNYHEYCGNIDLTDLTCKRIYTSNPNNPKSTPITQRAAIIGVATNFLLLSS